MPLKLHPDTSNKSEKSDLLKGLNSKQLEAVTSTEGPLLIIAGAGSGKTRVLTYRIAYMIQQGALPGQILALTFTNKAAKEMKQRIAKLVSPEAAAAIYAGTFHSIYARLLRQNADKIGYTSDFSIYDTDDSQSTIKSILKDLNITKDQVTPQAVQSRISYAKNRMIGWQEFASKASSPVDRIAARVYQEFDKKLVQCNAMDFDDLLLNMINLLKSSGEMLDYYQNRFQYILVDEYQDTNRSQYLSLNYFSAQHKNICVVGDDAQSIYRWRGAEIRNILDFQKDYPNAHLVRLEQNYRSTKTILSAADAVIRMNKGQIPKKLWTENDEGNKITLKQLNDDRDEAEYVSKIISQKISLGQNYSNVAVLYRTNAQSLLFENSFRAKNIPYIIIGGISFYKRKEIKDTVSYMKLLINPNDDESCIRALNEPPRGIGKTTIEKVREFANQHSIPLFQAFSRADEIQELQPRFKLSASKFSNLILKYSQIIKDENSDIFIRQYLEETGLVQFYSEMDTDDAQERVRNISQLISDLTRYYANTDNPTLSDYVQQISLITDIDEKDTSQNRVTLMTLHSAKGLEFPNVFICGLEAGLFPLSRTETNIEEEEEERRLFYVGITRAEKDLYLTYAASRMRFGEINRQMKSKFLNNIPSTLFSSSSSTILPQQQFSPPINSFTGNMVPKRDNSNIPQFDDLHVGKPNFEYSQIQDEEELKPGDKVRHNLFGEGKVISLAGSRTNIQAIVNFQGLGKKKLMLQYAKLEKIK
ncbi:MAG: UvrD-helicase domain-containing protein [Candidatus Kapabacteria bacterium]|nr:UvrD-helicase domain-containing protein [Candidatus Kapabacteria bacterium]